MNPSPKDRAGQGPRVHPFEGNRLHPLRQDRPVLWRVGPDTVAALVRAEPDTDGRLGARSTLASLGPGQVAFAGPHSSGELWLVPIDEGTLEEIPLEQHLDDLRHGRVRTRESLDGWLRRLLEHWGSGHAPRLRTVVDPHEEVFDGKAGEHLDVGGHGSRWLKLESGRVQLADREDAEWGPEDGWIPLIAPFGVRLLEDARLCWSDLLDHDPDEISRALGAWEHRLADELDVRVEQERQAENERLQRRASWLHDRSTRAMDDLRSVLIEGEDERLSDPPLIRAVRAVGRAMDLELRPPLGVEPSSLNGTEAVEDIARASRVRVRGVQLGDGWWTQDCGPLLAFRDRDGKPCALLQDDALRYLLWDPETRTAQRLGETERATLSREAFTFYRPLPERTLGLRDFARFALKPLRRDLRRIVGAGLMVTLLGMVVPLGTAAVIGQALPGADRDLLAQLGLAMLFAILGAGVFQQLQGVLLVRISLGAMASTQAAIWDRLLRLRPSFFRQYSTGDLQSRVMAVTEAGHQFGGAFVRSLFSGAMSLLHAVLLCILSLRLAMMALLIVGVVVGVSLVLGRAMRLRLARLGEMRGGFFGFVLQLVQGVGKLRVAGAEERAYTEWVEGYTRELEQREKASRLDDVQRLISVILPPLASAALFAACLPMLDRGDGGLGVGTFLAFYASFGILLAGVLSVADGALGFLDAIESTRRVEPMLREVPEVDGGKAQPGALQGQVVVDGLDFRYRENGPKILDGVSLRVDPGQLVALVGPSGSGKSTLLRMLLGFEQPQAGSVRYDGKDLSGLDVHAVRRQLGVVLQSARLMPGSIFQNVAAGRRIGLERCWSALDEAGLGDDVRAMPMGLHTVVSTGGSTLSGGQRQRLMIARALAVSPRIMYFDEATSALDNHTQRVVGETLSRLAITRIVIAHRLSTIRGADRVFVLDHGRLVEQGGFEELMADGGLFSRMMHRQLA